MGSLGVTVGPGQHELSQQVAYLNTVAFEWSVNGQDVAFTEVVAPTCKNAMRQGVPGPSWARRKAMPVEKMHSTGIANAQRRKDVLAKKLNVKKEDLFVSCTYIGIRTGDGTLNIDNDAFDDDN